MAYYLGIDGGGTKTTCVVGDEASQLSCVRAGASNITRVGEARARESLHQAIRLACAEAKIDARQLRRACIGVAGAGRENVAGRVREIVGELIPGEIEVVGDMEIALVAAFVAGPGVVVIAGTGSIAYGRDPQGRTARAGGWGFGISDEGSAYWIGRAAVASLLRAIDENTNATKNAQAAAKESALFGELAAAWKLRSLNELARNANSNPDFAALFPAVLAASETGDVVARQVLKSAGGELARLAATVERRLFAGDASTPPVPLAMVGGVFRHSAKVRKAFRDEAGKIGPRVEINPEVVEPVLGALLMARQVRKN